MLTVKRAASGRWAVWSGGLLVETFETHAEAWRWVDRHERRPLWSRSSTAERLGTPYYELPE